MRRVVLLIVSIFCLLANTDVKAQSVGSGLNSFISHEGTVKSARELFSQRYCIENVGSTQYIYLLMRVNEDCDLKFLNKYDCILGQKVGRIVTVKINVKDLSKFIKEKEIIEVDISRMVGGESLKYATKDLNAQDIWSGIGLNGGYTGEGVLIGVADWGIDYTHPTFYDSTGNDYRIFAAWDQSRKQGPAPEGFDYGSYFEGMTALLTAKSDTSNQYDTGYHSTHVGGIAAGSGAGTNYIGVAPRANLLFCTWICDEAHYIDCCVWMKNIAKAQNKRLVINNSWGVYNFGCMDGSSMLDEFINTMSVQDSVIFVVSAGNNGGVGFHVKADFKQSEEDTLRTEIEFNFPQPYTKDYWGQAITMQSENGIPFSSKLEFYNYRWEKIGQTPIMQSNGQVVSEAIFMTEDGDSIVYRGASRNPQDDRHMVDWEVRQTKYTNNNHHLVLVITANDGIVHAWNLNKLSKAVGNTGFSFKDSQEGFLRGDDHYGVSEPALTEKAITVAAHQYRLTAWQPSIANFSSRGPNLTPYIKPDISAPGYAIVSSVSSFSNTVPKAIQTVNFNGKDYAFATASGTSMSAPMVTGCVALMLQANPKLTSEEVKQIIMQGSKKDEYTGECPNDTWGFGKLNAYESVKKAEKKVGFVQIMNKSISIFPIPAKDILYIEGLDQDAIISMYDMSGRNVEIKRLNQESLDLKGLDSGLYVLNISYKDKQESVKFIKK